MILPTSTVPDVAPGAYPKIEYLVDEILPIGEVNLIAGSPGAGKTTLVLQSLRDFAQGLPVLGRPSHPAPVVYISLDRSYQLVGAALNRAGVAPGTFPTISAREQGNPRLYKDAKYLLSWVKAKFPDVKLLFVEALGTLTPGSKTQDYGVVADFLCDVTSWASNNRVSLWGSVHVAKAKQNEGYVQLRDKIMGSTAFSAFSATIIMIESIHPKDPGDQSRKVTVLPREAKPFEVKMIFNAQGQLVTLDDDADNTFSALMDQELKGFVVGENIRTAAFHAIAYDLFPDVSERTIERWLKSCVDRGLLTKPLRGYYLRPTS